MGYRRSIARALLCGLVAALGCALYEARGAAAAVPGTFGGALAVALPLLAALATVLAVGVGVVLGALTSIFGEGWPGRAWRRLRDDDERDRRAAALVLATGVALLVVIVATAVLARGFMDVKRKGVGALVIGLVAGGIALPLGAALWFPLAAGCLRVRSVIPRLGPVPATLLVLALPVVGVIGVAVEILGGLDTRNLHVTHLLVIAAGGALALLLGVVSAALPALRKLFERPVTLWAALGAGALSLGAVAWALGATNQDERVRGAVADHTAATRALVRVLQGLGDHDKDGYPETVIYGSTPDCDDGNPAVNPGATEIPDDGLDNNCKNGDAPKPQAKLEPSPSPAPAAQSKAQAFKWDGNVLLLGIDTLRADRLGARYKDGSLTPAMDALAARAVHFTGARAQAPNTPRSFPSIFASRLPSHVRFDSPTANYGVVLPENQLLFESTSAAGLHSFGVSSHFYFTEERGITQGAQWDNEGAKSIKDSNPDIAAPRVFEHAAAKLKELAAGKQRFVGFVHLFEPHSTYVPHPEYPASKGGVPGLIEKYDMEVRYVDDYVGKLVALLAETGLDKNTAIVLFADHGEAFGDHVFAGERMFFHGQTVYDELLHVPLLVLVPGVAPRRVDDPVMLVDLAPTVLDLVKLPIPDDFQGRSLLPAVLGDALPARPVLAELLPAKSWPHEARALLSGNLKLIWRPDDGVTQLFDLGADPVEKKDLSRERPDDAKRLKQELERWLETGTLGTL